MADEPIDYFLRGVDTGSGLMGRVQQARMQRQQMQQSAELFPLHKAQLENQLTIQSSEISTKLWMDHDRAAQSEAAPEAAELMSKITDWSDPVQTSGFYSLIQRKPAIARTPLMKEFQERVQIATEAKNQLDKANIMSQKQTEPEVIKLQREKQNAIDSGDYESAQIYQSRIDTLTTRNPSDENARILQNLKDSKSRLESLSTKFSALPEGAEREQTQKQIDDAKMDFEYWDRKAKGQQVSLSTTTPTGETVNFSMGSGGGVTGNIQTGLQTKGLGSKVAIQVAKYENAMELVKQLEERLDAGDVGILGSLKELGARTLGQVDKKYVSQETMKVRNIITQLRESVAREIPEGGRETEKQRQDVLRSLPSTGVFESEGTARAALQSTRDLLASRAKNYAAEMGRIPLVSMTPNEIVADYKAESEAIDAKLKAGLISAKEASALKKKSYLEHLDAGNRFFPKTKP